MVFHQGAFVFWAVGSLIMLDNCADLQNFCTFFLLSDLKVSFFNSLLNNFRHNPVRGSEKKRFYFLKLLTFCKKKNYYDDLHCLGEDKRM